MAKLSPQGRFRALDANGDPLNSGKLFTFEAGTSTPKVTYKTADEITPNTNPIILDANGYADVWLISGSYKFVLDDSTDVNQWTVDDISGSDSGVFGASVVSQSTNLSLTSVFENNLIVTTASLTISLLPAATATEGFIFSVQNTSSGNVTIDPDGAELVDGASTFVVPAGGGGSFVCDGSAWQLLSMVTVIQNGVGIVPIGSTIDYYGAASPDASFVFPFGQAISRTAFAELFALFSTTYGVGDGSTTFNIPDLRGRDGKGLDDMGGAAASRIIGLTSLGDTGGAEGATSTTDGHALTVAELAAHTHNYDQSTGTASPAGGGSSVATNSSVATSSTGSGDTHAHDLTQDNILDPYIGCNVLMRII